MNTILLSRMMIIALVLALCVTASFAQQIPVSISGGIKIFPGRRLLRQREVAK
ncbi:MAG: hypothetical protein ACLQO6_19860 [Desulfomonilaceae bacterium]